MSGVVNWTWPGRAHVIVRRPGNWYLTLWLFGRRLHWCTGWDPFNV